MTPAAKRPGRPAHPLLKAINELISRRFGIRAMSVGRLYPWQLAPATHGTRGSGALPEGAADWLRWDNPRLSELAGRYERCDPLVTTPAIWTPDILAGDDVCWFRSDNAYVWQVRGLYQSRLSYALCYYQFAASDDEGLLARLDEDDLFGVHLFEIDGRPVSRELIDSAREIQFLARHLGLGSKPASILDIGAGYGRLGWRLHQAFAGRVRSFAADAFAPSTFISEYHLRFRGAESATVVPLDEVDALLAATPIDLAVNIHSFSECTPEAVAWWVERLAAHRVPHLFVVPNAGSSGGRECGGPDGTSIEPIFARFGYRPIAREPRYTDPLVQDYGIDPVWLHLFELDRP